MVRKRSFFAESSTLQHMKKMVNMPARRGRRQSVVINDEYQGGGREEALESPSSSPEMPRHQLRRRSLSCGAFFEAGGPNTRPAISSEAVKAWKEPDGKADDDNTTSDENDAISGEKFTVQEDSKEEDDDEEKEEIQQGEQDEDSDSATGSLGPQHISEDEVNSLASDGRFQQAHDGGTAPVTINWESLSSVQKVAQELQRLQAETKTKQRELEDIKERMWSTQSDEERRRLDKIHKATQLHVIKLEEAIDDLESYC